MASPALWTWVWVSFGSWWWTGMPGMLQSMGSQRVRDNWATEVNWCLAFAFTIFYPTVKLDIAICSTWKLKKMMAYRGLAAWLRSYSQPSQSFHLEFISSPLYAWPPRQLLLFLVHQGTHSVNHHRDRLNDWFGWPESFSFFKLKVLGSLTQCAPILGRLAHTWWAFCIPFHGEEKKGQTSIAAEIPNIFWKDNQPLLFSLPEPAYALHLLASFHQGLNSENLSKYYCECCSWSQSSPLLV